MAKITGFEVTMINGKPAAITWDNGKKGNLKK